MRARASNKRVNINSEKEKEIKKNCVLKNPWFCVVVFYFFNEWRYDKNSNNNHNKLTRKQDKHFAAFFVTLCLIDSIELLSTNERFNSNNKTIYELSELNSAHRIVCHVHTHLFSAFTFENLSIFFWFLSKFSFGRQILTRCCRLFG